jgi:hypothetical protein
MTVCGQVSEKGVVEAGALGLGFLHWGGEDHGLAGFTYEFAPKFFSLSTFYSLPHSPLLLPSRQIHAGFTLLSPTSC